MTTLDHLPADCVAHVLTFISPGDVCQSSLVSLVVRDTAESDALWEIFLPSNYRDIISRLVCPVVFKSKTELFSKLSSRPLLIDERKEAIWLDKSTGKTCCMLSSSELNFTWESCPYSWSRKPIPESSFAEAVELVMTHCLEIHGKMNTSMLSPNTVYGAYLVVKMSRRAYGLEGIPFEVVVVPITRNNRYIWVESCPRTEKWRLVRDPTM